MTVNTMTKKPSEDSNRMDKRKKIVTDIFRLISERRPKDSLKYFTTDCVQHNPYVLGGMNELFDSMMTAMKDTAGRFPEPDFHIRNMIADGDMVAVYTQLLGSRSRAEMGGLRQVHLFRFTEDKIAEYWDITKQIDQSMPNAKGAF
jgi:predicted SnoaL-like aldol condensation-catalyzing enzyme